jgi:hypothetical protein
MNAATENEIDRLLCAGRLSLRDTPLLKFQRSGGARGRHRAAATPGASCDQRQVRIRYYCRSAGGAHANPPSQRRRAEPPIGITGVDTALAKRPRPARGATAPDTARRKIVSKAFTRASQRVANGRAAINSRPFASSGATCWSELRSERAEDCVAPTALGITKGFVSQP